jgi:hypothetical protein
MSVGYDDGEAYPQKPNMGYYNESANTPEANGIALPPPRRIKKKKILKKHNKKRGISSDAGVTNRGSNSRLPGEFVF